MSEDEGEFAEETFEEEGRDAKIAKDPGAPTSEEVARHNISHWPYRSWCAHCVRGRGRSRQHRVQQEQGRTIPVMAADYCFIGADTGSESPVLVMVDTYTGMVFAHVVKRKGADPDVIEMVISDLEVLGHRQIVFKSDQENPVKAVQRELAARRPEMKLENSPKYHSQANGAVENAIQRVIGLTRVLKDALEANIGEGIEPNMAIMSYMVTHAATLINRFSVDVDGRTPFEKARGTAARRELAEFGEKVLYQPMAKYNKNRKLDVRWEYGVFLGVDAKTNELIIGGEGATTRAWSFRRLTADKRWDKEMVKAVRGSPAGPDFELKITADPMIQEPMEKPQAKPPGVQSFRVTHKDIVNYGYTPGCRGCRAARAGGRQQGHDDACRRRIMDELIKTTEGKKRVELDEETRKEKKARLDETTKQSGNGQQKTEEKRDEKDERAPSGEDKGVDMSVDMGGPPNSGADQDVGRSSSSCPAGASSSSSSGINDGVPTGTVPSIGPKGMDDDEGAMRPEKKARFEEVQEKPDDVQEPPDKKMRKDLKALSHPEEQENDGWTHVCEIFSPPRVTRWASHAKLNPGWSVDEKVKKENGRGWDLRLKPDQDSVMKMVSRDAPALLIGCPPCTMFSQMQTANKKRIAREVWEARLDEAKDMMKFAVKAYREQHRQGRYFLHEHPRWATSWKMPEMRNLMQQEGVFVVHADMCRFGLTTTSKHGRGPVKKPTTFVTNSQCLAEELGKLCQGCSYHITLEGGSKTRAAGIYTDELCKAITRALKKQLVLDGEIAMAYMEAGEYYDETTKEKLDAQQVIAARKEELKYFRGMDVYDKVPYEQAMEKTGRRPIGIKWVDVKKADGRHRSRLVAKEFNDGVDQNMHAATPPLEVLKLLITKLADREKQRMDQEEDPESDEATILIHIDVHRAYFNAKAREDTYVEVPVEDQTEEYKVCGLLKKAMYGTRQAASAWQGEVEEAMSEIHMLPGDASPCLFYRPDVDGGGLVHGDDFVIVTTRGHGREVEAHLRDKWEIEVQVLGPGMGDKKQVRILNRMITWGETGIMYEADQKHAEVLVSRNISKADRSVSTPGEDVNGKDQGMEMVDSRDIKEFRADAARGNYLGMDRPDIQFSTKEISRRMAKPREGDVEKVRRLAKYLKHPGNRRLVQEFKFEAMDPTLIVHTDSDWGGCRESRKSTSGGVISTNVGVIKHWSSTQRLVALSSGEAELYAMNKGAAEAMGVRSLGRDIGMEFEIVLRTDASAAIGMISRRGLGKVRHLDTNDLWLQGALRNGEIDVEKVDGYSNIADVLTKYVTAEDLARHMREMGFHMVEPGSAALGELSHCWTEVGEVPGPAAQTFDASFNSFLVCEPISSPPICGHVLSTGAKGGCLCGDHYWVRGWG